MRGDRPFAYDLVIEYGAVSSRVALLLRSAEAKPRFFTSVLKSKLPHWCAPLIRVVGGGARV
jgi:hypothetical protein